MHQELKYLVQSHMVMKWQTQNVHPSSLILELICSTIKLLFLLICCQGLGQGLGIRLSTQKNMSLQSND